MQSLDADPARDQSAARRLAPDDRPAGRRANSRGRAGPADGLRPAAPALDRPAKHVPVDAALSDSSASIPRSAGSTRKRWRVPADDAQRQKLPEVQRAARQHRRHQKTRRSTSPTARPKPTASLRRNSGPLQRHPFARHRYMSSFSALALGMTSGFLSANAPLGFGLTQTMRSQSDGKRKTRFTSAVLLAIPILTSVPACGSSTLPPAATNFFALVAP